ncbi:hypothetical protein [Actinocorallia herbida]|nr:hypothetical protein [Actinocorallia herbida]
MNSAELARMLPGISEVRRRSVVLAVLEGVTGGDHPRYSFDAGWREGAALASMADGSGNEYSIVFADEGALVIGFDHESEMNPYGNGSQALWPGLLLGLPPELVRWAEDPRFVEDGVLCATLCLWRTPGSTAWGAGPISYPEDGDGAGWLFRGLLGCSPELYASWATNVHGAPPDVEAVRAVFDGHPLTPALALRMNPAYDTASLDPLLELTGYGPVAAG